MAFSELIKGFDKIRDYMRDFYILGFKSRNDFTIKSARTYDDEKRRIEGYLFPYVCWESDKRGKRVYVSLDASHLNSNPLYNAWKAKSFTDRDITLHFAILSALKQGECGISELTDRVCALTEGVFESQTVRLKANEYAAEGLLAKTRKGKTDYYALPPLGLESMPVPRENLLNAVRFFQGAAPFGFVGSTILDQEREQNDCFGMKHHYIVHTLEDGVLLACLQAMTEQRVVRFVQQSSRLGRESTIHGIPLQIFVSAQTGRRYLCLYTPGTQRLHSFRLDFIKTVEALEPVEDYASLRQRLDSATPKCWGVSFGGGTRRGRVLRVKLWIDEEAETYVLHRIRREGRGGCLERLEPNVFLYSRECHDPGESMQWVKTFTGRILSLEGASKETVEQFYSDMARMSAMYAQPGGEG